MPLKTFTLVCPDPDCAEEFELELDPATLTEEADLIECPACLDEWEWEYVAETDALTLLPDEEEFDETDLTDESGDAEDDE
jgi:hypothetical protein